MPIERKTLRLHVRDELLARMRSGEANPGQGINEVQLASELGVSRTPLREALISLESEGQITSENGKGFRYAALSGTEFEELGPIIAALEGLALEFTPTDKLREIGRQLLDLSGEFTQNLAEHSEVVHRDDEWHNLMLSACSNSRLIDMLNGVRGLIHRYESLLVADDTTIERVATEHAEIARCLHVGDIVGAQAALKTNWLNGVARILSKVSLD